MDDDNVVELFCYGIVEYYEIDELVEKFDGIEFSFFVWLCFFKQFKEQVEYYLDDEEQEFFQIVGCIFNEKQKKVFGEVYCDEMSELV